MFSRENQATTDFLSFYFLTLWRFSSFFYLVERKRFKYTSKISLFLWIHRIFGAETVVREIYCGILILVFADFHGGENIFYNDDNNSTFERWVC
jgi:hypothetical protein